MLEAGSDSLGFTEVPDVSDLVLAVILRDRLAEVRRGLESVEARLGRRLHAFAVPVEQVWD